MASVVGPHNKLANTDQTSSTTCSIYSLPDELLEIIFSYNESLEKSKNAILVDRRFYRILASKEVLIFKDELSKDHLNIIRLREIPTELVIRTCEPVEDICKLLGVGPLEDRLNEKLQQIKKLNLSKLILPTIERDDIKEEVDIEEDDIEEADIEDDIEYLNTEEAQFADVLQYFKGVKELDVGGNYDCMGAPAELIESNQGLKALFGSLRKLNMSEIGVDKKVLGVLEYCNNLQELNLSGNSKLVEVFEKLSEGEGWLFFRNIRVLDISKIQMSAHALFNIFSYFESLEELTISNIDFDLGAWLQDKKNHIISDRLKNLRILNLPGVVLTEKDLELFKFFTNLRIRP